MYFEFRVYGILSKHDLNDGLWQESFFLLVNVNSANLRNSSDGLSDNSANSVINSSGLVFNTI
jgi:hypothetical protein